MAKGAVTSRHVESEPRVRRGYFECRYGQLHVHNAIPPGGGFEEGTSLLCVHGSVGSGWTFQRFLALAGRDCSVYAPDMPGFGESDPPPSRLQIGDYAAALGDFLESMRFRQIDLLGYQCGALVAAELALARPNQVRRVALMSVPLLNDAEREAARQAPGLLAPAEDGSHLAAEWCRMLESYGPGIPLEMRTRLLAEKLRSAVQGAWLLAAAHQYEWRKRLALLTQSVQALRPKDSFWEATRRIRELLPRARVIDLPQHGNAVLETAPEVISTALQEFLRS